MDPSKFSVRVTNPRMIRHQRFADSSYIDVSEMIKNDSKPPIRYDKYETSLGSWCAPRKIHSIDSSSSLDDEKESRYGKATKNPKNHSKLRISQHTRRIEELSQPRIVVRKIPRSQENRSKLSTTCKTIKCEKKSSSQINLLAVAAPTIEPSIIPDQSISQCGKVTDRIAKLAEPKIREPVPINPLGKVNERALFAVATRRIVELATPKNISLAKICPPEKQDPFGVKPQALKAVCSPAIQQLARSKKLSSTEPKNL